MNRLAKALRAGALLAVVSPLLVLAAVGVVATVSELQGTWTWYLRMEKVISASTPVFFALLGVSFVAMVGLALAADR